MPSTTTLTRSDNATAGLVSESAAKVYGSAWTRHGRVQDQVYENAALGALQLLRPMQRTILGLECEISVRTRQVCEISGLREYESGLGRQVWNGRSRESLGEKTWMRSGCACH